MDTSRLMSSYELRQMLGMKDKELIRLKEQLNTLQKENETLKDWNFRWQKHRWNQELIRQSEGLEKEFKRSI